MALVLLGCGACGSTRPSWPPAPAQLRLTMKDYRFEFATPVHRGRTVFRVANRGSVVHRLVLVPLPADYPPLKERFASSGERRSIDPLAGIPDRRPGDTDTFSVDLKAGRYGLVCFVTDVDGRSHAEKGMVAEFRVK